jgi:hypothetical protein
LSSGEVRVEVQRPADSAEYQPAAERQPVLVEQEQRVPQPYRFTASRIYQADPVARFILETLKLSTLTLALATIAWSLLYLFILPSVLTCLRSNGAFLGSLDDWHAQLLLLLLFPTTCAFYLWQPKAIARVYNAILSERATADVGRLYHRSIWWHLSLLFGLAIILFDVPKMVSGYGTWWMAHNWLTIAGREASLSLAFYMVSMMAWRQLVATSEWRRLLETSSTRAAVRSVTRYGLSFCFLLALFGLRLSIEGIELPQRSGGFTPDYFAKIGLYVAVTLTCFFAPLYGVWRDGIRVRYDWLATLLQLSGIIALPLLGFVLLRVALRM